MDSGFPRCFSGNPAGAHCAHSRSSFTKSFIYMEKVPAQKAFGMGLLRIQFRGDFRPFAFELCKICIKIFLTYPQKFLILSLKST